MALFPLIVPSSSFTSPLATSPNTCPHAIYRYTVDPSNPLKKFKPVIRRRCIMQSPIMPFNRQRILRQHGRTNAHPPHTTPTSVRTITSTLPTTIAHTPIISIPSTSQGPSHHRLAPHHRAIIARHSLTTPPGIVPTGPLRAKIRRPLHHGARAAMSRFLFPVAPRHEEHCTTVQRRASDNTDSNADRRPADFLGVIITASQWIGTWRVGAAGRVLGACGARAIGLDAGAGDDWDSGVDHIHEDVCGWVWIVVDFADGGVHI